MFSDHDEDWIYNNICLCSNLKLIKIIHYVKKHWTGISTVMTGDLYLFFCAKIFGEA